MKSTITLEEHLKEKGTHNLVVLVEMDDRKDERGMTFNFRYRLKVEGDEYNKEVQGKIESLGSSSSDILDDQDATDYTRAAEGQSITCIEDFLRAAFPNARKFKADINSSYNTIWNFNITNKLINNGVTISDIAKVPEIHEEAKKLFYGPRKKGMSDKRLEEFFSRIRPSSTDPFKNSDLIMLSNHRNELDAYKALMQTCNMAGIDLKTKGPTAPNVLPKPVLDAYHKYVEVICVDQYYNKRPNLIFKDIEAKYFRREIIIK